MGGFAAFAATFPFVAVSLGATTGAEAELQFCDNVRPKASVAVADPQADQSWISPGWLEIDAGDCAEFASATHPSPIDRRGAPAPDRSPSGASATRVEQFSAPIRDLGEGQRPWLRRSGAGVEFAAGLAVDAACADVELRLVRPASTPPAERAGRQGRSARAARRCAATASRAP